LKDKETRRDDRSIEPRNEPSPLLRLFAIAAVRIEGDFEFDEVREQIIHSPQWIAEAKNQEDRHERYVLMTAFILDMLFIKIEELRKSNPQDERVLEYSSLEGEMHSCDVINLKCTMTEEGNDHHFTAATYASDKKEMGKGKDKVEMNDTNIKVDFTEERYSEGMDVAKENGYRRINCTARNNYRKAMRLAVSSGFFDPNKALSIRKNMVRAEDFSR
jgi:hypothetical protein